MRCIPSSGHGGNRLPMNNIRHLCLLPGAFSDERCSNPILLCCYSDSLDFVQNKENKSF